MKVEHRSAKLFAAFDGPDLIAHAGFVAMIRLAERCAWPALVAEKVRLVGVANGAGTAAARRRRSVPVGCARGDDAGAEPSGGLDGDGAEALGGPGQGHVQVLSPPGRFVMISSGFMTTTPSNSRPRASDAGTMRAC